MQFRSLSFVLACLVGIITVGCKDDGPLVKKTSFVPPAGPGPSAPPGAGPTIHPSIAELMQSPAQILGKQDPDVADYIRKKNWVVASEPSMTDTKKRNWLHTWNPQASERVPLTDDDIKILNRVKEIDIVVLNDVKDLDDKGVQKLCENKSLRGIVIMSDLVTDAAVKSLSACPSLTSVRRNLQSTEDHGGRNQGDCRCTPPVAFQIQYQGHR